MVKPVLIVDSAIVWHFLRRLFKRETGFEVCRLPVAISPAAPLRTLEERIRELCGKLSRASDAEVQPILKELRAALRAHNEHLRKRAAEQLLGRSDAKDRRRSA